MQVVGKKEKKQNVFSQCFFEIKSQQKCHCHVFTSDVGKILFFTKVISLKKQAKNSSFYVELKQILIKKILFHVFIR
jgi:ferredoxin-thioredoxin reductase catalytic subunit